MFVNAARSLFRFGVTMALGLQLSNVIAQTADLRELDAYAKASQARWQQAAQGEFLRRILPPRIEPSQLPDARSNGARLTAYYCVQCHALVNPAMHDAKRWEKVVDRMVPRMHGKGNMGQLMAAMMVAEDGKTALKAPTQDEVGAIKRYLIQHARDVVAVDRTGMRAALATPSGQQFERACTQCHSLPDPRLHTAAQWPAIVQRMNDNMLWMNRIVGNGIGGQVNQDPRASAVREPQLSLPEITLFLQRHARPSGAGKP